MSASYFPSGFSSSTVLPPLISKITCSRADLSTPSDLNKSAPNLESSAIARTKASTATNLSFHFVLSFSASVISASRLLPSTCSYEPLTFGCLRTNSSVRSSSLVGFRPALLTMRRANPFDCSRSALKRCSVSTICCEYPRAISGAATIASQAFSV